MSTQNQTENQRQNERQFRTLANLNLYSSPELNSLVTQAAVDRRLTIESNPESECILPPTAPLRVKLVEDSYPGWLDPQDWPLLVEDLTEYQAPLLNRVEIEARLSHAIAFTQAAMDVPNEYLWGGTVAPNYDCSGLMQAAFGSVGIQLPRDAYQQEGFLEPIDWTDLSDLLRQLLPGDLVFFGTPQKATHVGLYLGEAQYIHSSGRDHGRNGIGIDRLSDQETHPVSRHYLETLRGAGRVVRSY
jgi:cell wall-associated NlpC family hydrolase